MAIKVVFSTGTASISVGGLFQWDYGQVLEIESADIGNEIVEVHFACPNMTEALVRPCTFSNGVGTVTIPDQCLEQASTITAWIFRIEGTQGHTIKTITLPVTARTRPSKAHDIPTGYVDKYAELITEINEAVNALEKGDIVVAKATNADNATRATTAGNAESAVHAQSANSSESANSVISPGLYTITITDGVGQMSVSNNMPNTYFTIAMFRRIAYTDEGVYDGEIRDFGITAPLGVGNNYARVGNYNLHIKLRNTSTGSLTGEVTLLADDGETSAVSGTLSLYIVALGGAAA